MGIDKEPNLVFTVVVLRIIYFLSTFLFMTTQTRAETAFKELKNMTTLESKIFDNKNFLPSQPKNIHWIDSQFISSHLDQLVIRKATLRNVSFRKSSLKNLNVIETKMKNVDFQNADLRGTYWLRSSCEQCDFRAANLSEGSLLLVKMRGSLFNSKTILPFERKEAEEKGFVFNDK